jgi:hypothetical protein
MLGCKLECLLLIMNNTMGTPHLQAQHNKYLVHMFESVAEMFLLVL